MDGSAATTEKGGCNGSLTHHYYNYPRLPRVNSRSRLFVFASPSIAVFKYLVFITELANEFYSRLNRLLVFLRVPRLHLLPQIWLWIGNMADTAWVTVVTGVSLCNGLG